MKQEYNSYRRVGVCAPRAYYIPFGEEQEISLRKEIIDRERSDRFISLDGIWKIRAYQKIQDVDLNDTPDREIPVPSCVQMYGYDQIQYINSR